MASPQNPDGLGDGFSEGAMSHLATEIARLSLQEHALRNRISSNPSDPNAWLDYIAQLHSMGRSRETLQTSKRALHAAPFSRTMQLVLAAYIADAGDCQQAAKRLAAVLETPRVDVDALARARPGLSWVAHSKNFREALNTAFQIMSQRAQEHAADLGWLNTWLARFLSAGVLLLGVVCFAMEVSSFAILATLLGSACLLLCYRTAISHHSGTAGLALLSNASNMLAKSRVLVESLYRGLRADADDGITQATSASTVKRAVSR